VHQSLLAHCKACALALTLSFATGLAAQSFALHDGDRVAFLGDSITAQRFYTTYIQTAVHARFPEWNIDFYNAGVGGDNVFGGVAGNIDTRLSRDVLDFHPTVVTIMLGMNDRSHPDRYEEGYRHILQALHNKAPTARVIILTPTPVDGVTSNNPAANTELRQFVEIDRRLASAYHAAFIDVFHPVEAALERADKIDHIAALSLIPDRIHPQPPMHMLMAEIILQALGFPSTAFSITIDASTATVTHAEGIALHDLGKKDNGLVWNQMEAPDENRFLKTDGNAVLYEKLLGANHPGTRILQVVSLPKGLYSLRIDNKLITRTWTNVELAAGIDLQMEDTPAHKSGVALYYACSDLELDQTDRSRLLGTLKDADPQMMSIGKTFFQTAMKRSAEQVVEASKRVTRRIELMPKTEGVY
jgi:lysophospholipase L1-like esterase